MNEEKGTRKEEKVQKRITEIMSTLPIDEQEQIRKNENDMRMIRE